MRPRELRPGFRPSRSPPHSRDLRPLPVSALGIVLFLGFCGGGSDPGVPELTDTLAPVADHAELYYGDAPGGITEPRREVVTDRGRMADLWRRATEGRPDPPPLPTVDFERSLVILVSAGRMSAGDRIRVDTVGVRQERPGGERLFKIIYRKMEQCEPFEAEVYPVQIVCIRRPDGFREMRVDWNERPPAKVGDCAR